MGVSYEQGLTVDDILSLAKRESVLDFQALLRDRRKNGFQHFIQDLETETIDSGKGWTITKGLLVVQAEHNTESLSDYLEEKLGHHSWFQTRADRKRLLAEGKIIHRPILPQGYEAYTQLFKTLGRWGKNPAIDVIGLLKNKDGSISVQVIVRKHDKKFAFVGGMLDKNITNPTPEQLKQFEDQILEKCFQETLEEWYSNSLFATGSKTLEAVDKITTDELAQALTNVLNAEELSKLKPIEEDLLNVFRAPGLDSRTRFLELQNRLMIRGVELKIRKEDLEVMWVRIKCRLYTNLFPAQYQNFTNFLRANLVKMDETTNETDNRNTELAFMTTTPFYFCVDKEMLLKNQNDWLVEAKGGDDADSTKIRDLKTLFEKPMFSAHGRILLEALADYAGKNPEILNEPKFIEQVAAIHEHIKRRESEELGIEYNENTGVVRQKKPGENTFQFPVIAGPAQLKQLNAIAPQFEEMKFTSSVESAARTLENKLGKVRFARVNELLEKLELGSSALVTLDELSQLDEVNIILDNSHSMTGAYTKFIRVNENNSVFMKQIRTTRWAEAEDRFLKLLPLLALAGLKVNIRQLNTSYALGNNETKTFNFSSNLNEDNTKVFDSELENAETFVKMLFKAAPNGDTQISAHLRYFFGLDKLISTSSKRSSTICISDGAASDRSDCYTALRNRNAAANPFTVIACTNESQDINWISDMSNVPGSGVDMLEDYNDEEMKLRVIHGINIPYSKSTYLLRHVTLPAQDKNNSSGLQIYSLRNTVLTKEQLGEAMGHEIWDTTYNFYLETCPLHQYLVTGRRLSQAELSQMIGIEVTLASYHFYLKVIGSTPPHLVFEGGSTIPQTAGRSAPPAFAYVPSYANSPPPYPSAPAYANPPPSYDWPVIYGFTTVLGLAAVALAFTALNAASFNTIGLAVAGVGGTASLLSAIGLFANTCCAPDPSTTSYRSEITHPW